MVQRWREGGILPAILLLGLAAGCSEDEGARDDLTPREPATPSGVDTAGLARSEPDPESAPASAVRAELEPRAGTDVMGYAILAPRPGATAITVEIHGANSGYPYVAELVEGTCASPGGVVAVLSEITAGEGGDARYERMLDRALLPPDGANRAVWIRGADDPTAIVACGNLGASAATSATGR